METAVPLDKEQKMMLMAVDRPPWTEQVDLLRVNSKVLAQGPVGRAVGVSPLIVHLKPGHTWPSRKQYPLCKNSVPLPSDKNPIKQPHPQTLRESLCPRAQAHISPFFDQRIRLFFDSKLKQTWAHSAGSKDTGQEDPFWGLTQGGQ